MQSIGKGQNPFEDKNREDIEWNEKNGMCGCFVDEKTLKSVLDDGSPGHSSWFESNISFADCRGEVARIS